MRVTLPQVEPALSRVLASGAGAQAPAEPIPVSASVTLPPRTASLAAINGSALVAVGMVDQRVAVWNGRNAAPSLILAWSPGGRSIAVGDIDDGTLSKGGDRGP